jgi:type IV secretion system protein VirB3
MSGYLQNDPLFVGLTRRPMFLGVSFMFAGLNGLVCLMAYINTKNFYALLLMVVLHMFAYILCFKEPLIIELFLLKMQKCNLCKNKMFHGANSYDLF